MVASDVESLMMRGECHLKLHHYQQAVLDATRAVDADTNNPTVSTHNKSLIDVTCAVDTNIAVTTNKKNLLTSSGLSS